MLSHTPERQDIARALDRADAQRRKANEIPEVIEARAKSTRARAEAEATQRAFSRIFAKHHPKDDRIVQRALTELPDPLIGGLGMEPEFRFLIRCAISGLPVCVGDRVYVTASEHFPTFILADAVTVTLHGITCRVQLASQDMVP